MIRFYRNGFATLTRAAAQLRGWTLRHPRWSIAIAIVLIDVIVVVLGNTYAYADDGTSPVAPFLPGGDIHDSAGIPLSNYTVLPIDRGDMLTVQKVLISSWIDPIWTGHLGAMAWMIWLLDWLLSFEWVQWITEPFNNLAAQLERLLGDINWIPFALMISALAGGLAILSGRLARGGIEMLVSAVCAVLAVGVLANPVASLTVAGGALDTAQSFGGQIAAAVVTDGPSSSTLTSDDVLSEAVTTQLVDIFIRIPAQTITFGHTITGDCVSVFDDTMMSSAPVISRDNTVRDRVGDCDAAAKTYVQNPNFGSVLTTLIINSGGNVLFVFALAVALLFITTVIFFLVAAIKTMWNVYLGILPVSRYPLWRSLADVFTGLVSIVLMTVVLAVYLKIMVSILNASSSLGVVAQMGFVDVFMLILIFLLWRVRRAAKKAGHSMAEQLSQLGMGRSGAPQRDRSNVLTSMGQALNTAAHLHNSFRGGNPAKKVTAAATSVEQGPVDVGHMNATTQSNGRFPSRRALPSPQAAAKTADLVFAAANIAKAAPGGPAAIAGAAALQVSKAVVGKGASKAISAATLPPPRTPSAPTAPRRIVVDSAGVGHIHRPPVQPAVIHDITALQPAPRSLRNANMRELLAGAKE